MALKYYMLEIRTVTSWNSVKQNSEWALVGLDFNGRYSQKRVRQLISIINTHIQLLKKKNYWRRVTNKGG